MEAERRTTPPAPTREQVDARLRRAAELSRVWPPARARDMSPSAVTARLREWAEITELALALQRAGAGLTRA